MLTLTSKQVRFLRSASHGLSPVVMIGSHGLSETVIKEIDRSLHAHELIKIQVAGDDRAARLDMLNAICEQSGAAPVQHIGKQLVIYRPAKPPKIVLPRS